MRYILTLGMLFLFKLTFSQTNKIHSEGEIEVSGSEGWIRFNDISGTLGSDIFLLSDSDGFVIARGTPTFGRNFRMSGANLYLGEAFSGGGSRLNVGIAGDGSIASGNSWTIYSDRTLKKKIQILDYGSDIISQLNPVQYLWKNSGKLDYGFIAQEVEKVIPEIVYTDETTNLKSVDYIRLMPFLVNTIKQQQEQIDQLTNRIIELEKE